MNGFRLAHKPYRFAKDAQILENIKGSLRFENVSFSYLNRDGTKGETEALSNITVEISARGVTDLVNSTGTVTPGEARAVNVTANYPPEVVSARGFCRDTVPIVGTCKSGQPCMVGS